MRETKKDIILNAAEELMYNNEQSKNEITVDMIARKAGIGKGSIYYYFKSKDEIIDAVIERCYSAAVNKYFADINSASSTFDKLNILMRSILKEEFLDNSRNVIMALHLQDDIILHYKLMTIAIRTISPILSRILTDGTKDGSVTTDAPLESAEMIIAMLTLLLNTCVYKKNDESLIKKMKLFAEVLETCLKSEKGSFSFLYSSLD
ncbi:MAG: TetR/AcrR family transcriptional regulator [Ruminococcus sp.]|nr:TetR/AcrR family transcriptional regulator [Ruminococcus sp.]